MKSLLKILRSVLLIASLFLPWQVSAQVPQKMNYQAIIRNSNNVPLLTSSIGMRVSILQGSLTGAEIYEEIYNPNPQTNGSGIINIEIGSGVPLIGIFASIDWAFGPYFIKTEIDPTGGTNYTLTGTSPLLSVPYALFAKKADSISGGIHETDPVFGNSIANGIKASDTTNWNNKQNKLTSGNGISISANIISLNGPAHYVGQYYGGGIVFYVDQSGNHGLICSMIDISTSCAWSDVTTLIGPEAQSTWDGKSNSTAMISQQTSTSASQLCKDYTNSDYSTGQYSDWYLPAIDQLLKLYNSIYEVNKALDSDGNPATTAIVKTNYWSSSEYISLDAFFFIFFTGNPGDTYKGTTYYVRAIRDF